MRDGYALCVNRGGSIHSDDSSLYDSIRRSFTHSHCPLLTPAHCPTSPHLVMWPTATERRLLRLGVVVRGALLALAMITQTTMMPWSQPIAHPHSHAHSHSHAHPSDSTTTTTLLSHYDASAQLLLHQSAWSRCPQLEEGGVERALMHALSFQSHWDGEKHSVGQPPPPLRLPQLAPVRASALSMLTIAPGLHCASPCAQAFISWTRLSAAVMRWRRRAHSSLRCP